MQEVPRLRCHWQIGFRLHFTILSGTAQDFSPIEAKLLRTSGGSFEPGDEQPEPEKADAKRPFLRSPEFKY
jgi:hypothetical protein